MGPLRGVEKVDSFHRMLVSVSALADQFCQGNFDSKGASVVTDTGGGYWDVWASGSNSQSASQLKPDRKGIGPLKRGEFLFAYRRLRYVRPIRWSTTDRCI